MGIFSHIPRSLFLIFLVLVLLSYGQILNMYVWQDDNALFFKLANIEGRAGYLGAGPFGDGAYKYTAFFYIPIYYLFGFNTLAYFTYTLIVYFISTIFVYKVFSKVINNLAGKVAGLLYACGFIASDGFIRIFNSFITSLSIILISCLLLFYWKFYQDILKGGNRPVKWYILALLSYFALAEFAIARTHYLITVIVIFEALFLSFLKPPRSIIFSLLRLIPFVLIFYRYFILNSDQRAGQVGNLIASLGKGDFYNLYGFLSSVTNLAVPNYLILTIQKLNQLIILPINLQFSWLVILGVYLLAVFLMFRKLKLKYIFYLTLVLVSSWLVISRKIFQVPILNLDQLQLTKTFIGGLLIFFSGLVIFLMDKYKKLYIFLLLWVFLNIAAYCAYSPLVSYETVNRYFAHSLFALVGLFGLLFYTFNKSKVVAFLIIAWGIGNLFSAIYYQGNIIKSRSNPPGTLICPSFSSVIVRPPGGIIIL